MPDLLAWQVLKVIRYSTKLALATALKNDSSDLAVRLKEFETSIGTSRCGTWCPAKGHYRALILDADLIGVAAEKPTVWANGCLILTLCATRLF